MRKLWVHAFSTPLGTMRAAATETGLAALGLPGETEETFIAQLHRDFGELEIATGGPVNQQTEQEITDYINGSRTEFTVPLDLHGTEFQTRVLKRVAAIPFGRRATYSEVAADLGSPRAARAVGTANARNRIPIIIPCHRVVATTGLGGYGGGLELKKRLLDLEQAVREKSAPTQKV